MYRKVKQYKKISFDENYKRIYGIRSHGDYSWYRKRSTNGKSWKCHKKQRQYGERHCSKEWAIKSDEYSMMINDRECFDEESLTYKILKLYGMR